MSNESTNIIETMSAELEHLRPMEASLEMAEADVKAYKQRVADLENEVARLQRYHDAEATKWLAENQKLKEERRWRKFPEEKPEWGKEVIVVDDANKQYIVRFSYDMKWISWGNMNTCESKCVKYWMPQPSAPKEAK